VYDTSSTPVDCTWCTIDVDYTLTGVPPGDWTISAGKLQVAVEVQ